MTVFDVEADGLLDVATKIHCLSYEDANGIHTIFDYDDMREFLVRQKVLIGHNIIRYDIPLLGKLLGINIGAQLIDTLALSWYLNHSRIIHGLDSYGKDYNRPKPPIDDWEGLTKEEYQHRCEEDVWINSKLWGQLKGKLLTLYDSRQDADRLIQYLSFKMDCAKEQERSGWKLDVPRAQRNFDELTLLQEQKVSELQKHMPLRILKDKRTKPAKPYKKDGTLSVTGAKWFNLLASEGLPKAYLGVVEVTSGEELANPNSPEQVKDWLFNLGWIPKTFKHTTNSKGVENQVPQVRVGSDLCSSVLRLADGEDGVRVLDGLTVIQHRLGVFKGFLDMSVDGWLKAEIAGFTNTLRFKHKKPLVNLPGVDKPWGKEIRGCLIAPEGHVLCGSDMVSLESTTKRHYMHPYDPEYVKEMSDPLFDEHLDLAKHAGKVSQEDIDNYMKDKDSHPNVKKVRTKFKPANYSAIYGIQPRGLSRDTGVSLSESKNILDMYWKRNWSVLEVVKNVVTKRLGKELWLLNPVSNLWYSLRYPKDIFSTLNQGTGVYCFDKWIGEWREVREQLTGQMHDEIVTCIPKGREKVFEKILRTAIDKTNKVLILNVDLDVDVQFGGTYADIH